MMKRILLLEPLLRIISDGEMIKLVFMWVLRISAGLSVFGVLFASYQLWSRTGRNLPASYFLIMLILQVALLLLIFVIFNILMIRAEDIKGLSVARGYPVVSIWVVLIRTVGEVLFFTYAILGIAGGLALFFTKKIPMPIPLPFLDLIGGGGATGFVMMIAGILVGFAVLVFAYFISELIMAPVETAMNTRKR